MTVAPGTLSLTPLSALPTLTDPLALTGVAPAIATDGTQVADFSRILANQAITVPVPELPHANPAEPVIDPGSMAAPLAPAPAKSPQTGKILPPDLPVAPKPARPGKPVPAAPQPRLPRTLSDGPAPDALSSRDAATAGDVEASSVDGPVAYALNDPVPQVLPREAPATPMMPVPPVQTGTLPSPRGQAPMEPPATRRAAAAPTIPADTSPAPDLPPVEAIMVRASTVAPPAQTTPEIQRNKLPRINFLRLPSNLEPEPSTKSAALLNLTSVSRPAGHERLPVRAPFAPLVAMPLIDQLPVPIAATPQTSAAIPTVPHDFVALVERLSAAREAVQPQAVSIAVSHAEFGPVRLHFRHEDGALSVAMASADPDFARAVAAAPPVQPAAPLTDTAPLQQRGPEQRPADTGGGQSRGQAQSERRDERGPRANPSPHREQPRKGGSQPGIFA